MRSENTFPLRPSLGFLPVWRRNFLVWRKLMGPSIVGNFGEPLMYLLALGYGFGRMVGEVGGLPYMVFLASGIVVSSAMTAASFEAMYSAFTRMQMQQTWVAMLHTPLEVEDVVLGEVLWAATKALINSAAILIVAAALGLVSGWGALWVLPVVLLTGVCFGALAMIVTALARGYDVFTYYFTLLLTPMLLLSGVFFPLETLPKAIVAAVQLLPLAHAIALIRPLIIGEAPGAVLLHLAVIGGYALLGLSVSIFLVRRRLHS
jgi:lipooligosaccharide transport system permease protein